MKKSFVSLLTIAAITLEWYLATAVKNKTPLSKK